MPKQDELKTVMITCYKCGWSYSSQKDGCPMCGANPVINEKDLVRILGEYIERQGLFSTKKECTAFVKKFKKDRKRLPNLDELWTSAVNYVKLQTMDKKDLKQMKEKKDIDLKAQMEKMRLQKIQEKQGKKGGEPKPAKKKAPAKSKAEVLMGNFRASFSWKQGKTKGKYFFGKPKVVAKTRHTGSALSVIPRGADMKLSETAVPGDIAFKGNKLLFKSKDGKAKVALDMREIVKIKKNDGKSMDTRVVSILLNSHGKYAEYGENLIFTIYVGDMGNVEELYEEIIGAQKAKEMPIEVKKEMTSTSSSIPSQEDRLEALRRRRMEMADGSSAEVESTQPKEIPFSSQKPQQSDKTYIICPTCGTKNPAGSKFCLEDGTPLG